MPLQQISVSPLEWGKDSATRDSQHHDWKLQETVFATTAPNPPERCGSQASSLSNGHDICRICHCEGDSDVPLIAPCYCAGSLRYVHQACLQQWIKSSDIRSCELCKFQFIMHSKIKPFSEWETLEMSGVERRKLLCSVTFHAVALTCVVWSLYVLIDRTAEEIQRGLLEWPFWTKLIVVAIGFTGGLVFMYIQCKAYLHLCRRWRAFNRVIFVQNAPEKVALQSTGQAPLAQEESVLVSETCCGVITTESNDHKHRNTLPVSIANVNSTQEGKKISTDCLKEHLVATTPSSAVESVVISDHEDELLNEVVFDKSSGYQSVVTKSIDGCTGILTLSDTNSSGSYNLVNNRIDLCGRKFSYDEPSGDSGEMSHLLQREDKSHHGATGSCHTSGFVLLPTTLTPPPTRHIGSSSLHQMSANSTVSSSSSEESFPSPSVRLLQGTSPKPWVIGPANSGITWISDTASEQPLSSLGSQSPLLTKTVMKDDASSTN